MNPDVRAVAAEMREMAYECRLAGGHTWEQRLERWASALESASQSDAVDAARYRWLRENGHNLASGIQVWFDDEDGFGGATFAGATFDRELDALMSNFPLPDPPQEATR